MKFKILIITLFGILISCCNIKNVDNKIIKIDSLHYILEWNKYSPTVKLYEKSNYITIPVSIGSFDNTKSKYNLICNNDSIPYLLFVRGVDIPNFFFDNCYKQFNVATFGEVDSIPLILSNQGNLTEYIKKSFNDNFKNNNYECYGHMRFSFIVDTLGNVSNFTGEPLFDMNGECDKEIEFILKKSKWKPALKNNKKVCFYYFFVSIKWQDVYGVPN